MGLTAAAAATGPGLAFPGTRWDGRVRDGRVRGGRVGDGRVRGGGTRGALRTNKCCRRVVRRLIPYPNQEVIPVDGWMDRWMDRWMDS